MRGGDDEITDPAQQVEAGLRRLGLLHWSLLTRVQRILGIVGAAHDPGTLPHLRGEEPTHCAEQCSDRACEEEAPCGADADPPQRQSTRRLGNG